MYIGCLTFQYGIRMKHGAAKHLNLVENIVHFFNGFDSNCY
jgi:hypothetical protein